MEMTQEVAFKKFTETNPDVKINKRKFDSLRPVQVRRITMSSRIVCCCTYCENVQLQVQTLKSVTRQNLSTSRDVLDSILCPKTGTYNLVACLKRQCENCGTKQLREELKTVPADKSVKGKNGKKTNFSFGC